MVTERERIGRSYIRYALYILLVTIATIGIIGLLLWFTGKKEHVEIVSIVTTLILASIGIMAAVLSLDLNAKALEQNERMIRLTQLANRPFFDKDTFVCSGTFDQIIFSVTNIGGKPAYISKITIRIRGKLSLDWEGVPSDDQRTVESGSVFFHTVEIDKAPGHTKERYDPKESNVEAVVIRIDYKNFEHKDIEMKDLVVSHAFNRDVNQFLSPIGRK
ncbi:MAG: hypothetical protein LBH69_05200 [Methanomassiliicoccaceae archaeon]|jgi:plastocyanin domain-containing protein|nr:hypothetical protein [Methanomassiliicoccaceae archaeon]